MILARTVSLLIFCFAVALAVYSRVHGHADWILYLFLLLGASAVPVAVTACYRVIRDWRDDVLGFTGAPDEEVGAWHDQWLRTFKRPLPLAVFGVLFALVALVGFHAGGVTLWPLASDTVLRFICVAVGGFFAGLGLCEIFLFSLYIFQLGRFPIVIEPHRFGVSSVGNVMLKCYLAAVSILLLFTLSIIGQDHNHVLAILSATAAPAFIIIVGGFVACQFPLHRQMVDYKRVRIKKLIAARSRLLSVEDDEIPDNAVERLKYYESRLEAVDALPDWPFNARVLVGLIGSTAGSFVPTLLSVLLDGSI